MPNAVFRCDASPTIGTGHVMRCLAFASHLADLGWSPCFLTNPVARQVVPGLNASSFPLLNADDASVPDCELLVVDHYEIGWEQETAWRANARSIMVIDDLANRRHDCDWLVDPTLGRRASDYGALVPENCALLLGPMHAPLREQFAQTRSAALDRRLATTSVSRILVTFGGGDATRAVLASLNGLSDAGFRGVVDLLPGDSTLNEALEDIANRATYDLIVHSFVENIAELMLSADLCICAAGSTSWERCSLGLPSLVVITADNQQLVATNLEKAGAVRILGNIESISAQNVSDSMQSLIDDAEVLERMSSSAADMCDGRGSRRLSLSMLPSVFSRSGGEITLRPMTIDDTMTVFDWQSANETRRYARVPKSPTLEEHQNWMISVLSNPKRFPIIIESDGAPAGVLRFDREAAVEPAYEVSILIAPNQHGNGIGSAALRLGSDWMRGRQLKAFVSPQNAASKRVFERSGYAQISDSGWVREIDPPRTAETIH